MSVHDEPNDRPELPGGRQFLLSHGDYAAVITEVGANLRSLTHRGRDLVVPFREDEIRPGHRGAVLAPWPNRVVDGRYTFGGTSRQLDLSEPARGHAIHGLVAWSRFEPAGGETAGEETGRASISLEHRLPPQPGYPHSLSLLVRYELTDAGLGWSVRTRNTGPDAAPYGVSAHPYLVAGPGKVDDWILEAPVSRYVETVGERMLPGAERAVAGSAFDFREPRRIGDLFLDHAFTGVVFGEAGGAARLALRHPDGGGVALEFDDGCPWLQLHTADQPDPARSRLGLAAEPMTCPPDAFNSGRDLVALAPGRDHLTSWRIAALD